MYLTLRDGEPAQQVQDIYLYSNPKRDPENQQDVSWPSPTAIYAHYALNLIAFLAFFYLGLNQFVKIKRH
jgi:hypothetical protein